MFPYFLASQDAQEVMLVSQWLSEWPLADFTDEDEDEDEDEDDNLVMKVIQS